MHFHGHPAVSEFLCRGESLLQRPNAGSVTKINYTFQGDTASHTEMHMNAGKSETVMIMDAKYLGSCPAGMKPGDAVTADGKKIGGGN